MVNGLPGVESPNDAGDLGQVVDQHIRRQAGAGKGRIPVGNGRVADLDEEGLARLLKEVGGLEVKELWITGDVRPGRGEEKWLNVLLKKSCFR